MSSRTAHEHVYAIVLAGGGGTRLWPVSRKNTPKQILPFIGSKTLLQTTMKRIQAIIPAHRIYIVTNIRNKNEIEKQIKSFPKKNILYEPEKRDTATAICYGAAVIYAKDPHAVVTTVNSDGFIQNEKEYARVLLHAGKLAYKESDSTVLIGIKPTYPETGYGYIKVGKQFRGLPSAIPVHHVQGFVEKPNLQTAKRYIKRLDYLWNPAMFVWRVDTLRKLYKKYLPKHFALFQKIEDGSRDGKLSSVIKKHFISVPAISIDYGIMEKTKKMLVVPANFGWADIGHWRSVKDVLSKASRENIIKGLHVGFDTTGSLIYGYSNRLIATIGLSDLVIIDTPDVLLVCPKEKSQDVKKVVEALGKKGLSIYV